MTKTAVGRTTLLVPFLVLCVPVQAVTLGQVDDFENSPVQGWGEGGGSPNPPTNIAGGPPGSTRYLRDISSGGGGGSGTKMTMFNTSQWSGDYVAAGITEIRAMVRVDPTSAGPLSLRVGFQEASQFGQVGYVSAAPVVVPNDGTWYEVVFPIEATDLLSASSGMTYAQTMTNVGQFRIYHAPNVQFDGTVIAATMGVDNITAVSNVSTYTGWLWDTSNYSSGFSVQEENCFGQLDFELHEDLTWTAAGTDEVCRGRDTQSGSRGFINPAPSIRDDFESQSTRPLVNAGGNLYELYGEDVEGGIGEGEARFATVLAEPTDARLLFVGGHESVAEPGNLESAGFLHLLVKATPSIVAARTAADLEGTSWHVANGVHARNEFSINGETASATMVTVDFEAGGVCTYSPSTVFPDFFKNRDAYVASQFSNAGNLNNRGVQAGVNGAAFSNCSYAVDVEGYLVINVTLTLDSNPGAPIALVLRFAVSDDEQYLVVAPAAAGPDSGFQGLAAGFRSANALPANGIDGNYLFYLMLSEFGATGTFHSGGEFDRQEFDFRGRGLFSFDSSVPGTVPEGETGTWFACTVAMVQNGFELGYSGDDSLGTATVDAEVSAEFVDFSGCDYRLDSDGGLSVHVIVDVPKEPEPFEATLRGYVNNIGEVFALALGTSEPPPSVLNEDFASVFFVLGMQYTGNANGNEDGDALTNLEEFQFPVPAQTVPLLLRRSDTGRWFGYEVDGFAVATSGSVDLESGLYWGVESIRDFNRDANDDLLLRSASNGQWKIALMDGSSLVGLLSATLAKSFDWELAANADFNGDGMADVLLRNQVNGRWRMYLMDGADILQEATVNIAVDLFWDPVASGDFDGDGAADLLIRRSDNGAWRMYRFDGTTVIETSVVNLSKTATSQFEKVADFNGDGKLDVLIRHTDTGRWRVYTMDGTQVLASSLVSLATGATWQLEAVADFDSDGNTDTLLRNGSTGQWRLYLLDGATVNETAVVSIPSTAAYGLQAVADFNLDGNADILLRNSSNGQWSAYLMNGTTVESSGNVPLASNLIWSLVAPTIP